jgi:hypothetical protein
VALVNVDTLEYAVVPTYQSAEVNPPANLPVKVLGLFFVND